MAETEPETGVHKTGVQETEVQEDKSPGITDELRDTIESLKKIKDNPEEFKTKENNTEKKKLEDDLIKIMNEFNDSLHYLFNALGLDNSKLEFPNSESPVDDAEGINNDETEEDEKKEDGTKENGTEEAKIAVGGNKSKTQKKQSKNKNKNKTQKKH